MHILPLLREGGETSVSRARSNFPRDCEPPTGSEETREVSCTFRRTYLSPIEARREAENGHAQDGFLVSRNAFCIICAVIPSYVHGCSSTPLLGETIGACLDRICEHFADCEALISRHQGLRYTYGQLKEEVDKVARGMISIGVEKGDRVGLWSPNCAEWLIVQYALAKVGAIMVNINPAYRLRELEHALTQSCLLYTSDAADE